MLKEFKMKLYFVLFITLLTHFAQAQLTTVKGFAPKYIGEKVRLFRYQDLITYTEEEIASTEVQKDSTFTLHFYFKDIERLKLQVGNNYGFLYLQPEGNYEVYFPLTSKFDAQRELGSEVELAFRDLDTSDINYKILQYDRWEFDFLGKNYQQKSTDGTSFSQSLDTFKLNVQAYYKKDSSLYMRNFVKFRIAELDELSFLGRRNDAEKFDHYLRTGTVHYHNDPYMKYINKFFAQFFGRSSLEINNKIYLAILKSSPSLLLHAMGDDYRMRNLRLRELIMIKALGEVYYDADFPQTNIEVILDSLSKHTLFEANRIIAQNIHNRLTNLVSGSPTPRYTLNTLDGKEWNQEETKGKYKYIQFVEYGNTLGQQEMNLMKPIYDRYHGDVEMITVFMDKNQKWTEDKQAKMKSTYPWMLTVSMNEYDLKKAFKIETLPFYVLIDPDGFIVQIPALRPSPNGEYETIDKTFYNIHQVLMKTQK